MTELQKQIVNILNTKDFEHLTCDDIAWKLKKHKMHIGRSVKTLVEKGILEGYRPYYGGNIKYFMVNNDSLEKDKI